MERRPEGGEQGAGAASAVAGVTRCIRPRWVEGNSVRRDTDRLCDRFFSISNPAVPASRDFIAAIAIGSTCSRRSKRMAHCREAKWTWPMRVLPTIGAMIFRASASGMTLHEFCRRRSTTGAAAVEQGTGSKLARSRSSLREESSLDGRVDFFQRISAPLPLRKAAEQRSNARDPHAPEFERQTGARSFVRSGAVQDDFAVTRNLVVPGGDFVRRHAECAGNHARVGKHVESVTQVDDVRFFAVLDHR